MVQRPAQTAQQTEQMINLDAVAINDPRNDSRRARTYAGKVSVLCFYFDGAMTLPDLLCGFPAGGNFYEDGHTLSVAPPGKWGSAKKFTNAEAAFQALKSWHTAHRFRHADGNEAFNLKRAIRSPDFKYAGYGSNWAGMMAVLEVKFSNDTYGSRQSRRCLLATKDAFLMETNVKAGRDNVWSNNYLGDGKNWLGLQLMLLRDNIAAVEDRSHQSKWTTWLVEGPVGLDVLTGKFRREKMWQLTVLEATNNLKQALVEKKYNECANKVCGRQALHNQVGGYCSQCSKRNSNKQVSTRRSGQLSPSLSPSPSPRMQRSPPWHKRLSPSPSRSASNRPRTLHRPRGGKRRQLR